MSYKIKKQKAKDYSNIEIDKIFDDIVKKLNIKDYKKEIDYKWNNTRNYF